VIKRASYLLQNNTSAVCTL